MAIKKTATPTNRQNQRPQPSGHSSATPKHEMLLDFAQRRVASKQAHIDSLDAKANFVLTSATVLVGTGLAAQLAIVGKTIDILGVSFSRALPLALLVCFYLWVVIMAYQAYRLRKYSNAPEPKILIGAYQDVSVEETQRDILDALVIAIDTNEKKLKAKAFWTRWALNALVGESVALAVILIVEALL